eukprot:m.97265 g.97265  ORF g.97265 m.97265 type:complete len:316 (+) comp8659_c0_seq3:314-1261(+)
MAEPAHRAYSKAEISILNAFGGRNIVAIGESGHGKSSLLNRLLSRAAAELKVFVESDNPESETKQTVGCPGYFCGDRSLRIVAIDTPGLNDSAGFDARNMEGMAEYLRGLSGGLHGLLLVVSALNPRFDANLQRVIRILLTGFPAGSFWSNVCVVFTKSFDTCIAAGQINTSTLRGQLTSQIRELARSNGAAASVNIETFFIDSRDYSSANTNRELALLKGWLAAKSPITKPVATPVVQTRTTESRRRDVASAPRFKGQWVGSWGHIFGVKKTVHAGTTVTWVEEVRDVITHTTAAGSNVSYGEWRQVASGTEDR